MTDTPPPPVLASARVLAYALVDATVTYTGRRKVIAAGRELGPVPCLAIARQLSGTDIVLLHCDAEWDVLAASTFGSVDDAKRRAEEGYAGLNRKWQDVAYSDAEVEAYLDEEDRGLICSFCGRHPHEVDRIVTGHGGAAICEICIKGFRSKGAQQD